MCSVPPYPNRPEAPDPQHFTPPSLNIGKHYEQFLGWGSYTGGITARFEDQIGARGGGDDRRQRETGRQIIEYLDIDLSDEQLDDVIDGLFSERARTFRRDR